MFAVPGWSISTADLKPQGEASVATPVPDVTADGSKKRKREQGKNNGIVTKSNVDEMYRHHIEGHAKRKDGSKKNKKNNSKEIKGKENNDRDVAEVTNGTKSNLEAIDNGPENVGEKSRPSKRQKKGNDKKKKHEKKDTAEVLPAADTTETLPPPPPPLPAPAVGAKLTPLQQKMRDKLMSARFRHLNETLYTTPSKQAYEMFTANPELFAEYHAGFSRQVKESWPSNPVDGYISSIQKRGAVPPSFNNRKGSHKSANGSNQPVALPRRPNGICTIADMGCGDARLARVLTPSEKRLQLKLLSFDLHAPDPLITKADVANLPLADGTVDVAVFCLSLMGTNWVSFVEEAYRVLRGDGKGECWVSEVKSRFGRVNRKKAQIGLKKGQEMNNAEKKKNKKNKKGGKGGAEDDDEGFDDDDIYAEDAHQSQSYGSDETDISAFVEVFKSRGFILKQESVDKSNKMFIKMEFLKAGGPPTKGKYAGATSSGKPAPMQTKKKFIEHDREDNGLTAEDEARVLKPCVYKIR